MNLAGCARHLAATPHVFRMTLSAILVMVWVANSANASAVGEVEPNDTFVTAQNVDAFFSLDFDANIGNELSNTSESMPHVTVLGTGDGSFDYYSFTVASPGKLGIFDIDYAWEGGFDSYLRLYNSVGDLLSSSDDSFTAWGQGGSTSGLDSYLEYTFAAAGTYAIEVGSCCVGTVPNGTSYQLQISIGDPPPPPPPPGPPLPLSPGEYVITFEELIGAADLIPNGYFGFNWNNMGSINGPAEYANSGYTNGAVSGIRTALNWFSNPADVMNITGEPFDFLGAYFTAAWNDGLLITVEGYRDGLLLYTTTFEVDTAGPTYVPLGYLNVDELRFASFGGVNAGLGFSGEHFVMDDFTFRVIVPEPSALLLAITAGIVLCGWQRCRVRA